MRTFGPDRLPTERSENHHRQSGLGQYDETVDRESAYELLAARTAKSAPMKPPPPAAANRSERRAGAPAASRSRESATDRFVKNVAGSVGRAVGNHGRPWARLRGILGGLRR